MRFTRYLLQLLRIVSPVLFSLLTLMIIGAGIIALAEDMNYWKALYLTFVTALTIGYGDVAPVTVIGRITCLLMGLLGLMFFGIVIAVTNRALAHAVADKRHIPFKDVI